MTGHSYESSVTAPTCTKAGYTTYTCACGHSYTEAGESATGLHNYTIEVEREDATCGEAGYVVKKCATCEATDSTTLDATGKHDMVDATCAAPKTCKTCGATEGGPDTDAHVLGEANAAGWQYCTIAGCYHAYKAGGSQEAWQLVTNVSDLKVGDKIIIVASGSNVALSTTQNGNNRGQATIIKSNDKGTIVTPLGSDVQIIVLEAGNQNGTFAFYVTSDSATGYLYAAHSSSNYLKTETTLSNNSSWTIEISDSGVATIKAQGTNTRNWLRYNSTSSLFSCYSSGQADIAIYKQSSITASAEAHNCAENWESANCTTAKKCTECGRTDGNPLGHTNVDDNPYFCDRDGCGHLFEENLPAADSVLTIEEAIALGKYFANDTYTPNKYYITGTVQDVTNDHGNMHITDANGNELYIYGSYDATGTNKYGNMPIKHVVGDTVTVYGVIGAYNDKAQMKNGWTTVDAHKHEYSTATCTVLATCRCGSTTGEFANHVYENGTCQCGKIEGSTALNKAVLDLSNKNNRTEFSTSKQVWSANGITVTNEKGSSSSNVADYAPPRFYANSTVTVEGIGMKTIVFVCNNSSYANALKNSISDSNATATVSGSNVTVTFNNAVDSFTIKLTAQVRMGNSITVNP